MRVRVFRGLLILLAASLLSGCSDNDSGGFDNTGNNACGASTLPIASQSAAGNLPAAVPPAGAAIAVQPAFAQLAFTQPVAMLTAPNDERCWFIVELAGRVIAFENADDANQKSTFIDISAQVYDDPQAGGLLGMAFHPDYRNNRQVFLSYMGEKDGEITSYISRFTSADDGITLDPASEEVLISIARPIANHNGGNIAFGPDGYLYIGFGDGGFGNDSEQNAQNTQTLLGTMLRIDVDSESTYSIPDDNPFAGNPLCDLGQGDSDCPEIYAWGLRNPWRWSFDLETGDLWLGDVGQSAIEEIDIIDKGGNYGWPYYEGTRCNTEAPIVDCSFVALPPVTEYPREGGRSVTGGYVYRGTAIPELAGVYLYADFLSGNLFQYYDPGSGPVIEARLPTNLLIVSFGQSIAGELYLVDLPTGTLHQIVSGS